MRLLICVPLRKHPLTIRLQSNFVYSLNIRQSKLSPQKSLNRLSYMLVGHQNQASHHSFAVFAHTSCLTFMDRKCPGEKPSSTYGPHHLEAVVAASSHSQTCSLTPPSLHSASRQGRMSEASCAVRCTGSRVFRAISLRRHHISVRVT